MVEVGLAFVCALVAWSATAALGARAYRYPGIATVVWVTAAVATTVALSAAFPAALLDFSNATFRILQIGVGLLGPLFLGWGAVEYAVESPRGRFGTRLVVTTLTVVPLVVLSLDRLRGRFDSGYPAASEHYDAIPMGVLALVHLFVLVALLTAAVSAARRMPEAPARGRHELGVLGLVALAALLEILVSRFGLGPLGQLMMLGAVSALWVAVLRASAPPRRGGRRRGRGRDRDEDEFFDDDPDEEDEEEPVRRRRRRADHDDFDEEPVRRGRRRAEPGDFDAPEPEPRRAPKVQGIITIYTLKEGHEAAFDDCVDEVVDEVSRLEPDTLLYACHTVPSSPQQRIVYAIYRDRLAYEEHEQQPHVIDFARRCVRHIVATNVIELSLAGASAADNLPDMLMPH
ncbi:antibiotic biosynthesis monooxygenase [Thermobifida halotolerans]|uniref:Antibiotic biosynthesis monooxygenase n=1 Tax=Thermobifida halotolerans TaxID=483545 RepID=A0A399G217_9ACTN|nr:antibiotic biosynthesis monooxygenase [Thermobifida halotolerans]UOE18445.1 antibiotic biosynthesis monooxygenase [Thermobifida halotolerans]